MKNYQECNELKREFTKDKMGMAASLDLIFPLTEIIMEVNQTRKYYKIKSLAAHGDQTVCQCFRTTALSI